MHYCKKHKIPLTSSFDPNNLFCLECEKEPKGTPTSNSDGFRITAPPVGADDKTYYAVLEDRDWGGNPQYVFLFRTADSARAQIELRKKADLSINFYGAKVSTTVECKKWFDNGMSKEMYAIWLQKDVPKVVNGNHCVLVDKIVGAETAKKMKQAALKPKYGGSLNKRTISSIPATPAQSPPAQPTPAPAPAQPAVPVNKPLLVPTKKPIAKKSTKKPIAKKVSNRPLSKSGLRRTKPKSATKSSSSTSNSVKPKSSSSSKPLHNPVSKPLPPAKKKHKRAPLKIKKSLKSN